MIAIKGMEEMPSCCKSCPCSDDLQCNLTTQYNDLKGRPNDCPLVEIVTCKDCKHRKRNYEKNGFGYCGKVRLDTHETFFCRYGERRE